MLSSLKIKPMKKAFFYCVTLVFLFSSVVSIAQHETEEDTHKEQTEHSEHSELKKHSISAVLSHTNINSAKENRNGSNWIAAPSFCFNYNFNINHKWAIGLHNDIIVENIDLDHTHDGGDGVIRQRPISMAIMGTYKPLKYLAFLAGGGVELSKHEDFPVIRLGVEAPMHLPNNWEVFGSLTGDIGIDSYDSITFGIGFAKLF